MLSTKDSFLLLGQNKLKILSYGTQNIEITTHNKNKIIHLTFDLRVFSSNLERNIYIVVFRTLFFSLIPNLMTKRSTIVSVGALVWKLVQFLKLTNRWIIAQFNDKVPLCASAVDCKWGQIFMCVSIITLEFTFLCNLSRDLSSLKSKLYVHTTKIKKWHNNDM